MDGRAVFGAHTAWDLHGLGGSREASVCQHLLGREGGVLPVELHLFLVAIGLSP